MRSAKNGVKQLRIIASDVLYILVNKRKVLPGFL